MVWIGITYNVILNLIKIVANLPKYPPHTPYHVSMNEIFKTISYFMLLSFVVTTIETKKKPTNKPYNYTLRRQKKRPAHYTIIHLVYRRYTKSSLDCCKYNLRRGK